MIESMSIASIATFGSVPEVLNGLSQFNFLFGSNGTGKTTVSRVIADEDTYPTCKVSWKAGTRLQALVYNHDFVERNFTQSSELKGVFTLGEKQVDSLVKIAAAKVELDALTTRIETLTMGLQGAEGIGGKKGELAALEADLKDKCWAQKQKHDVKLQGAFEGYRGSAEKFKTKVVQELAGNAATFLTLPELEKNAETVFGPTPTEELVVPVIETAKLVEHETDPVLKKRVVGKDDIDIAAMVKKLENSDWVREGRTFYDEDERICPFCQQSTTEAFVQSLNEYFDEAFVKDSKAIDDLSTNYSTEATRLRQQIASIISASTRFMDIEKLKAENELLESKITINVQRLARKKKEASQLVELESLTNVVSAMKALIDSANSRVAEHNKMVANLVQERNTLTAQVWKYVLEQLKADLGTYKTKHDGLNKAINSMNEQIATATSDKGRKTAEIRELEKQATSVQPTIDAINSLLLSFGFQGFALAQSATGTSYKLIRPDGSDAKATLSEGEKTFVTFLYFYHLLKGSVSDSGMTTNRIVVFDDPVSSLDSDILFIVGSLIEGLFNEVRLGLGYIKQIFLLTHNVYFHKEVTYNRKRPNSGVLNEETFWIVTKSGSVSKLARQTTNPIKTSYELLWVDVRKPERSNLTIQNTLRRILEYYFNILGDIDLVELCAMFDGREKIVCKSLCSWVHDGSHYAHDDLYVSIDDSTVENYLKVFREIFDKADHIAHYKMMMADDFVEEPVPTVAQ